MRPTSTLLAFVVVLCFVSEAGAWVHVPQHDLTVTVAGNLFGFRDGIRLGESREIGIDEEDASEIYLGPLGEFEVPFTATQGLVGFCVIVVGLVALVTVGTVRWKRKRAAV